MRSRESSRQIFPPQLAQSSFSPSLRVMHLSCLIGGVFVLLLLLCKSFAFVSDSPNVVIVILSQENAYHRTNAENLKGDILDQAKLLEGLRKDQVKVLVVPDAETHVGYWTIVPLLPRLRAKVYTRNPSWIYFCEDISVVNLKRLIHSLQMFMDNEKLWMGFGLKDEYPTIVHHFAEDSLTYPLISAGLAISGALLKELNLDKIKSRDKEIEFSIDAPYELAMFFGEKYPLKHRPSLFCDKPAESCASYPNKIKRCRPILDTDEIYFAVKTCRTYHSDRVPFIKKSWGKDAMHIKFFSNVEDLSIPTTSVSVRNTETGHCIKTMKILNMVLDEISKDLNKIKWVVLTDDDTILSVKGMQSHLSCYKEDSVIGERYGYKVHNGHGYNYPTGGGGIAFGKSTLGQIVEFCSCPQIDSPDDMVIGLCLSALNITLTHSPLFHQARPMDYPNSYVAIGDPVSFHKHWNVDPMSVYNEWFTKWDTNQALHQEF